MPAAANVVLTSIPLEDFTTGEMISAFTCELHALFTVDVKLPSAVRLGHFATIWEITCVIIIDKQIALNIWKLICAL